MAYKQRWINFFQLLDGNKNGTIEKNDAGAALKAFKASGRFSDAQLADIQTAFQDMITGAIKAGGGADSKVTQDELLALAEKKFIGKNYADAPAWWNTSLKSIFAATDQNNNGIISEKEFTEIITSFVPSVPADLAKAAFQQVEGNLDVAAFQRVTWNWVTSNDALPQDVILTLAVNIYST